MEGSARIVELLNELLTLELTAINQYFIHSKMLESWGYERLAKRFRDVAFAEMRDAEEITERILFLEGVPNLQRLSPVSVGETPIEQLQLALDTERGALKLLRDDIAVCAEEREETTRVFLEGRLAEEERHVDWLETQLELAGQVGETNYLTQQIRE